MIDNKESSISTVKINELRKILGICRDIGLSVKVKELYGGSCVIIKKDYEDTQTSLAGQFRDKIEQDSLSNR